MQRWRNASVQGDTSQNLRRTVCGKSRFVWAGHFCRSCNGSAGWVIDANPNVPGEAQFPSSAREVSLQVKLASAVVVPFTAAELGGTLAEHDTHATPCTVCCISPVLQRCVAFQQ